jgi:hypothetical protein
MVPSMLVVKISVSTVYVRFFTARLWLRGALRNSCSVLPFIGD